MSRGGAYHPLVELTLARVREFFREPEAIFWAFIFPLVLTLALAAAFPSAADRQVIVGLVDATKAPAIQRALEAAPGLRVVPLAAAAEPRLEIAAEGVAEEQPHVREFVAELSEMEKITEALRRKRMVAISDGP